MLLMPTKDWHWEFNEEYGQLALSLDTEMSFLTAFKTKMLIPDALKGMKFSVEHAKFYIRMLERLPKVLMLSDAAIVQTALNATAAHFLLTPQMPKSWFFDVSDECVFFDEGKVFQLKSNNQTLLVLVIDVGIQSVLVMNLSSAYQLSDTKSLAQFDTIKVMHNRLHPLKRVKQIAAA
ncbi:cell division protein ZapC [Shewanella sp. SR44-3]|uniref:cell division protein ZapC n=1 Tax=unclassified Shewanella TaxID=196818 RepID=UPI0015F792BE|nr:cell division protein ZapC [Shewanella sp. SR44-3]MBB1267932.1 cell division protein ZapC [Shewanella sp. SR44-3]